MRFQLSSCLLIVNAVLFIVGLYFWIVHSTYRIMILYAAFSTLLLCLTGSVKEGISPNRRIGLLSPFWLGSTFVVLSALLMLGTVQSLYSQPPYAPAVLAVVIVVFAVILLTNTSSSSKFQQPYALLAMFTFIVLYTYFSLYIVQPNLMSGPAYANVDAYRDYVNAVKVIRSSGFTSVNLIEEQYYFGLPVVPVQIAIVSLLTGLPVYDAHLALLVVFEVLNASCSVLFIWAIVGKHARLSGVMLLPALIVLLQPYLFDPFRSSTPLGLTIPLLSMVLYLSIRSTGRDPGRVKSSYIAILLLILLIVPMHAAAIIVLLVILAIVALFNRGQASTSIITGLSIVGLVLFMLYLTSQTGGAGQSVLRSASLFYYSIQGMFRAGPSFLSEVGATGIGAEGKWDELSSFLGSVPSAFILATISVVIVRLIERPKDSMNSGVEGHGQMRPIRDQWGLCLCLALLSGIGYASSYLVHYGGVSGLGTSGAVDIRYLLYPFTPLALFTSALAFIRIMRNMNTAKRLLLLGLLAVYAVSVVTSPVFLNASSPLTGRLIPIQSERSAASFLSTHFASVRKTQIVADWPFSLHVQGVLYSTHSDLPNTQVYLPNLIFGQNMSSISQQVRTIVLIRQYFLQNAWLKSQSPYAIPLMDSQKWAPYDKIFDDSSTSIYLTS